MHGQDHSFIWGVQENGGARGTEPGLSLMVGMLVGRHLRDNCGTTMLVDGNYSTLLRHT